MPRALQTSKPIPEATPKPTSEPPNSSVNRPTKQPQAFGRIDVLVSNATVNPFAGPILETPPEAIDKILDINIKAGASYVEAVVPTLNPRICDY
jgi:NADP-dependent 3-hydroxy acid dehydrogenase YdfG